VAIVEGVVRHRLTQSGLAGSILLGSLLLATCAEGAGKDDLDEPPPVTIRYGDRSLDLKAWTYCFGNVCADDLPPAPPPDVGAPEEVMVEFPLQGWSFTATFVKVSGTCERSQRVQLRASADGGFVLKPVGAAHTYDVTLFGKGDGDLKVTFRWKTPRNGPPGNLRSIKECSS
jgi:hypothetical protein